MGVDTGRLDPRHGYVTCPRARGIFEAFLAIIDAHIKSDILVQEWELIAEPEAVSDYEDRGFLLHASNNGADYLAEIKAVCLEGLGYEEDECGWYREVQP